MHNAGQKLSEALTELASTILRDPDAPSASAVELAMFLAHVAWNESVGAKLPERGYHEVVENIEAENPGVCDELHSKDWQELIRNLIAYKKSHSPVDHRRILSWEIVDDRVRVEWLEPAPPNEDPAWELQLCGMVRVGQRADAIRFLRETLGISQAHAVERVNKISSNIRLLL